LKKIMIVFGTRPEAIKMAPLVLELKKTKNITTKVCVTAQHRDMLDMVLNLFGIDPDYDLDLMKAGQNITSITVRVLQGLEKVYQAEKPDLVLVHGDTTTTMAAALAAFYLKIPVGHVEAGLRSGNIYSPYPEEMNRRLTGDLAELHFAPTERNKQSLIREGNTKDNIIVTGNTVIDALLMVVKDKYQFKEPLLNKLTNSSNKLVLLTAHRRENWGLPMQEIFNAIKDLLLQNPSVEVIFPVHLNPVVRDLADEVFGDLPRAHLIPPLDYEPFVNLMARAYLILTDSGGIQEEAPALGKPVLVLRTETERPEAVEAGTVKIVGIKRVDIIKESEILLNDSNEYNKMAKAINPYGDGMAAERIAGFLNTWLREK